MTNPNIEMAPSRGRHFLLSSHFWLPVALLGLGSILFRILDLDLSIQSLYYHEGWILAAHPALEIIYRYSNIPALLVALGALFVFFRSFGISNRYTAYRKLSLYLVLVLILGPGLIVNSILKDKWGRPRPRDIVEYGGRYQYEEVLSQDPSSPGKSFPCGHATMGFYFYALAFVAGLHRKSWFRWLLIFATLYGLLIGWVRIAQGGHFASDVLFAGGIVYLCSWALWKILKLDTRPYHRVSENPRPLSMGKKLLILSLGILILIGVSLATPYSTRQNLGSVLDSDYWLRLELQEAELQISFSDSLLVHNSVSAFGFPSSKARITRYCSEDTLRFVQKKKGFFTEFGAKVHVVVDTTACYGMLLALGKGSVRIQAPPSLQQDIRYLSVNEVPEALRQKANPETARYIIYTPKLRAASKNNSGQEMAPLQTAPK